MCEGGGGGGGGGSNNSSSSSNKGIYMRDCVQEAAATPAAVSICARVTHNTACIPVVAAGVAIGNIVHHNRGIMLLMLVLVLLVLVMGRQWHL